MIRVKYEIETQPIGFEKNFLYNNINSPTNHNNNNNLPTNHNNNNNNSPSNHNGKTALQTNATTLASNHRNQPQAPIATTLKIAPQPRLKNTDDTKTNKILFPQRAGARKINDGFPRLNPTKAREKMGTFGVAMATGVGVDDSICSRPVDGRDLENAVKTGAVELPGDELFQYLLILALNQLGYSVVDTLYARGCLEIRNWKQFPLESISDNITATIEHVLGSISDHVTLKIRLLRFNHIRTRDEPIEANSKNNNNNDPKIGADFKPIRIVNYSNPVRNRDETEPLFDSNTVRNRDETEPLFNSIFAERRERGPSTNSLDEHDASSAAFPLRNPVDNWSRFCEAIDDRICDVNDKTFKRGGRNPSNFEEICAREGRDFEGRIVERRGRNPDNFEDGDVNSSADEDADEEIDICDCDEGEKDVAEDVIDSIDVVEDADDGVKVARCDVNINAFVNDVEDADDGVRGEYCNADINGFVVEEGKNNENGVINENYDASFNNCRKDAGESKNNSNIKDSQQLDEGIGSENIQIATVPITDRRNFKNADSNDRVDSNSANKFSRLRYSRLSGSKSPSREPNSRDNFFPGSAKRTLDADEDIATDLSKKRRTFVSNIRESEGGNRDDVDNYRFEKQSIETIRKSGDNLSDEAAINKREFFAREESDENRTKKGYSDDQDSRGSESGDRFFEGANLPKHDPFPFDPFWLHRINAASVLGESPQNVLALANFLGFPKHLQCKPNVTSFYNPYGNFYANCGLGGTSLMFNPKTPVYPPLLPPNPPPTRTRYNAPLPDCPSESGARGGFRKRSRVFIDPLTEIPKLETWFCEDTHPSSYMIEKYTDELNRSTYRQRFPRLEPKNLQLWFKNHRAKVKRSKETIDSKVGAFRSKSRSDGRTYDDDDDDWSLKTSDTVSRHISRIFQEFKNKTDSTELDG